MATPQLLEQDRAKLDGIVSKMIENGESDDDIQFVVNDFKQKYASTQPQVKQGTNVPFTPFQIDASPSDILKAVAKTTTGAYKYGGKPGSKEGTDCSGAMCSIAKQAGIDLPRTAKAQFEDKRAKSVKPEELKPGDLVFFGSPGPSGWHVGFYQGGGKFLHQSTDNKPGLSVGDLNQHAKKYGFRGAKRYDELSAKFAGSSPQPQGGLTQEGIRDALNRMGAKQGPEYRPTPPSKPTTKSGLNIVADALRKPEYAPNVAPASVPPTRTLQDVVDRPKTVAKALETRKAKEGERNVQIQSAIINTKNQEEMAIRPAVGREDLLESEINPAGARLVPTDQTSARKVLEQSLGDPYRSVQTKVMQGLQQGVGRIATGITGTQIDDPAAQAELQRRLGSLLGAPGSVEELVLNAALGVGASVASRFAKPLVQAFAKGDKAFNEALDALPIAPELKPKFADELGVQLSKSLESFPPPKIETPSGLPPNLQPKPQAQPKTQPTPSGVSAKAKREVKPVVKPVEELYHGGRSGNSILKANDVQGSNLDNATSRFGVFTTPDAKEAARYAEMHGGEGRVYAVQNNIKNPYEMPWEEFDALQDVTRGKADGDGFRKRLESQQWGMRLEELKKEVDQRKAELVAQGYDGIIVKGSGMRPTEYIHFNDLPVNTQKAKPAPPTPPKATPESPKGAKEAWEMGKDEFESQKLGAFKDNPLSAANDSVDSFIASSDTGVIGGASLSPEQRLAWADAKIAAINEELGWTRQSIKDQKANPYTVVPRINKARLRPEQQRIKRLLDERGRLSKFADGQRAAVERNAKDHEWAVERALKEGRLTPERARELGHFEAYPDLAAKYGGKAESPKTAPKPLESIGGPPREIPLSKPTGEIDSKIKEALKDASAERQSAFEALQKARAKQNAARKGGKQSGAAAPLLPEEIAYAKTWLKEKGLQAASAVEDFVRHMVDLGYDSATAKRILKATDDGSGAGAPTGLARQFEDAERKVLGLEPTRKPAESAETLAEIGKDLSNNAASYVESSVKNGRSLEPAEVAAVTHYKRGLANEYKELGNRLRNGDATVVGRMADIESEFDKISTAAQNTRTKWHDLGESLQVAFDPGYSRVDLKTRALRANQGEPLGKKHADEIERVAARNELAEDSLAATRKAMTVEDVDKIDALRKEVDDLKRQLQDKRDGQAARKSSDKARKIRATALNTLHKYGIKTAPVESTATRKMSKQSGAINIPIDGGDDITKAIRSLVRSYILDSDNITLDGILARLKTDVPGLDEDQALMILSNKYRTRLLEADVAKLDADKALREIVRDAEFRQKSTTGKAVSLAGNLLTATARGLQAGLDLSAPLIQGLPMLMQGSKKDWVNAWGPMLQATFGKGANGGEEFARLVSAEIKRHPMYPSARKAGLDLTEMAGAFERQEEFFAGDLIETMAKSKIPIIRQYAQMIVRSNAAYTVFNNKARFDTFVRFAKLDSKNPDFLSDAAMMINILSGRGSGEVARTLGSKAAGNVFYAPRFAWSGWQNAYGAPLMFAKTPLGRQVALQNYAKGGAFMAITLAVAGASPFVKNVNTDIRSTDFGAITFNDGTQINPFARILQPYRTIAQSFYGRVSRSGNYTDPTSAEAQGKIWGGYILNKLSPAARLVITGASGTMYDNNKDEFVGAEPGKLAVEAVAPMAWRNLFGSMTQKDVTLIGQIMAFGALLGADARRESKKSAQTPAPPMHFIPEGWRVMLGQRKLKETKSKVPSEVEPPSTKTSLPAGAKPAG